ncbi:hypothetical protein N7466_010162 [Penicillium verhagenii]|uniref:uncharacterized protein n=1 Tax=Penicillium verhagenii TaxID=1562060 RepID=UPI0025450B66|nr:uncharacterized protein N7466_010162 [Penicillium verhagenii]KAJ5919219.1 hypothetical protein N7466_010162 [Penicillium verhagenii]
MAETAERTILRKDQLEISLGNEKLLIKEGTIKDDNPLDLSEPFRELCSACRKGDLKVCQEKITEGVNVNARDAYDYTPLILSTDPLQPLAAHITSLLTRPTPLTSDIMVTASDDSVHLHKFILAARSPYFHGKLAAAPESTTWKLPSSISPDAFTAAIRYLYLGEPPRELRSGPGTGFTESEVFAAIDKISSHLEIHSLMDSILDSGDRRMARQRRTIELAKGRDQLEGWFRTNVLGNKIVIETSKVNKVKWDRSNAIYADVLLQADDLPDEVADGQSPKSTLFPCHRAMLLRSEFFQTMFSSSFREAQVTEHLHIISVDCAPDVLEIILTFLYTERADFPLEVAVDVLFAADMLFIEKLKTKAAVVISTLGSGGMSQAEAAKTRGQDDDDIDIYAIMRAAWLTRVQRLEEFVGRFLAYRLEAHIDTPEFAELIAESASRIKARQETDSIELLDDIRFYLNERFRLRFNDAGLDEMMDEQPKPVDGDVTGQAEDGDKLADGIEALDVSKAQVIAREESKQHEPAENNREIRTLDGVLVEDEFDEDAMNYDILMEKLDAVLETLNLEA